MTIAFWASVALLLAGGLLFVLPPLLRPTAVRRAVDSPLAAYREQRAQVDADFAQGRLTSEQHQQALLTLRESERELSQLVNMVPVHIRRLTPDVAICVMPGPLDLLMARALNYLRIPFIVLVHEVDCHPGDGVPFQSSSVHPASGLPRTTTCPVLGSGWVSSRSGGALRAFIRVHIAIAAPCEYTTGCCSLLR